MQATQPLRRPEFRRLLVGITVSRVGDALTGIALVWTALQLQGPAAVGLVMLCASLPGVVAGPVAGAVVDRIGVKKAIVLDSLFRLITTGGLAVIIASGQLHLALLLGFAALNAFTSALTEVALDVATPLLVPDEELEHSNALISGAWNAADLIGPLIGGIVIDRFGIEFAFAADSLTFLLLAVAAPSVTWASSDEDHRGTGWGPVQGMRLLLGKYRASLFLTLIGVLMLAIASAQEVLYPVFVAKQLHLGAAWYGLLVSICGALSFVGTFMVAKLASRVTPRLALAVVIAVRGALLAPLGVSRSFPAVAASAGLASVFDAAYFPIARTAQQRLVPPQDRPRVSGARSAFGVLGYPTGSALGGLLAASASLPTAIGLIVAAHVVPVLMLTFHPRLRNIPGPPPNSSHDPQSADETS